MVEFLCVSLADSGIRIWGVINTIFPSFSEKEKAVPYGGCSIQMSGDVMGGAIINFLFKAPAKCRCTHLSGS